MDRISKFAIGSIVIGVCVLALKYTAYRVTGSIALYSDALESIINVAAACAVLAAVRLSAIPADANHNFGHYKAEYFSAVLEGVLIVLAAMAIFYKAYLGIFNPRRIDAPLTGLMINGLAGAVNAAWCWKLIRQGRQWGSPALLADGQHLLADVISSAGVIAGILLAMATGFWVLDPILAALVAVTILWSGWKLVKDSVGGLMDAAPPAEITDRIRALISRHSNDALQAHDLRVRRAGRATFIDFHLVVAGDMKVSAAHDICDRIEAALKADLPGAIITIHVEPENKAKHSVGIA